VKGDAGGPRPDSGAHPSHWISPGTDRQLTPRRSFGMTEASALMSYYELETPLFKHLL